MTLSAAANRVSFAGDGSTTSFAFAFTLWAASEMKVYLRSSAGVETLQTLTTHYSLSPSSYPATSGNVVFVTAPASGVTVVLIRTQALSQALDLVNGDPMPSDLIERRFDIMAGILQNMQEQINRAPLFPITSSNANKELPDLSASVADNALVVNSAGDGFTLQESVTPSSATVTAAAATVLDDTTTGAMLTTLGLSAFFQTLIDDATAAALFTTLGFLKNTATIDFANVADNATSADTDVTVTGAVLGDLAFATSSGDIATTDGVWLMAKVVATNTVGVALHNDSSGAFNAASQTVNVFVIPKSLFGL